MTTLITGDLGFVGQHLTKSLRDDDHHVTGYDLAFSGQHDVRNYETLRSTIETVQPEYIFHLAAQALVGESVRSPRRTFDVNLLGTINLLEAVRQTGLHTSIMLAGTSEEYGYETQTGPVTETSPCFPTTPYGVSKLAAGQLGLVYAHQHNMQVVVTRAFNHIGPGQTAAYAVSAFARRIVEVELGRRDVVTHGNLDAIRNFTDVRDIVRAYRYAIGLPSGVYNLCSTRSVPMHDIINGLIAHAKKPVNLRIDDALYRPSATTIWHNPSAAKFIDLTDWRPEIELEQTLGDILTWWRTTIV